MTVADGSQLPTSPDGGTLKTLDSGRLGLAVFDDAAVHNLARLLILPDRCVEVEVYVEAMDAASGRLASGSAKMQVARLGVATATIVGAPLMLTYTPNVVPWAFPTVAADLFADPLSGEIFVQVVGLAGVSIRWRASIKVIGAQAQQVT
jgi:hypothetical protein